MKTKPKSEAPGESSVDSFKSLKVNGSAFSPLSMWLLGEQFELSTVHTIDFPLGSTATLSFKEIRQYCPSFMAQMLPSRSTSHAAVKKPYTTGSTGSASLGTCLEVLWGGAQILIGECHHLWPSMQLLEGADSRQCSEEGRRHSVRSVESAINGGRQHSQIPIQQISQINSINGWQMSQPYCTLIP